jgi:hypothetical protein
LFIPCAFGIARAQVVLPGAIMRTMFAGGCTTAQETNTASNNGDTQVGFSANHKYVAGKFAAVGNHDVCRADLPLKKVGSPTFTMTCGIWTHDAAEDDPNAIIGTGSTNSIDSSTLTTSYTTQSFTGISATGLTDTTIYWIVILCATVGDGSNYVHWDRSAGGPSGDKLMNDADGAGTWTTISGTRYAKFSLFGP